MSANLIYITASNADEARRIGAELVRRRLAACANVLGRIDSVFWWEGAVQEEAEAALILKTRQELVPALVATVKELHSYSCPCIVALPVVGGNPDFLRWVEDETR